MNLLDTVNYYLGFGVTGQYGEKRGSSTHKGVDLSLAGDADLGKPVYSLTTGTVARTGYQADGAGNYIVIKDGQNETKYFHLQDKPKLQQGDKVVIGDTIGKIGNTGVSTGPHLHVERWENGSTVDPYSWLKKLKPNTGSANLISLDGLGKENIEMYALAFLGLVFFLRTLKTVFK